MAVAKLCKAGQAREPPGTNAVPSTSAGAKLATKRTWRRNVNDTGSKVLVDTNAWIDLACASVEGYRAAYVLNRLLLQYQGLTRGVVETELYQGVRDDEPAILEAHLDALIFS